MLPLADLQKAVHHAILEGKDLALATTGAITLAEAISIHRGTAIGGIVNALRLAHPTVDALVGERYFDQAAHAFVLAQPPRRAALDGYGEAFAEFLQGLPSANAMPYLADVARLDWTLDRTLHSSAATRTIAIDGQVSLRLPAALTVLALSYPAHAIREALGDDDAMAAICLEKTSHALVIWRRADRAVVLRIKPAAACFLGALLAGASPADAMAQAGAAQSDLLAAIQTDIFAAPFCTVLPSKRKTP